MNGMQNTVFEGAVIVLILGWIMYRQMRWQVLDQRRMWRMPIILAVIGVFQLKSAVSGVQISTVAVSLLVLSAVLSVAVGAAMGQLSQLRAADGQILARTGWVGSLLWLVLVAVRIGVDVWAHSVGATIVTAVGVILLMLALNRVGRGAVLLRRSEQFRLVAAH
ncbi:hypothetical protein IU500_08865 [Nocardia terpenica]|uniref:hypothetical protein n=1 Tax=Nocardia terpenica TaxID=455432 RepID=UPI0018962AE9|nr:hypothetical protein [Nocardia terpenica]MBF6060889.1 hypothetical protein [Nocardia terpenica]MBF6104149.1 hypothetical protein [Nocardia terpenica]MBF6111477.1 hypothetical protein [Nocardia terpenica]MBF6118370.1 hypothetical protein [Nocardia terpenica]MBF6155692.1 hypothetical protein [Nocardia terpenica]